MAALIWTFVILLHNFSVSVMESSLQESSLEQFSVAYVFLVVLVFVYNFSIFYSFFLRRPSTQPFDFAAIQILGIFFLSTVLTGILNLKFFLVFAFFIFLNSIFFLAFLTHWITLLIKDLKKKSKNTRKILVWSFRSSKRMISGVRVATLPSQNNNNHV